MRPRTLLAMTFVLVTAVASAQSRPAAPTPPAAPQPPAPAAGLGLTLTVEPPDLDLEITAPALTMAFDAASMGLDALGSLGGEVLADWQEAAVARGQRWTADSTEAAEYERGMSYLDSGRYDRALEAFEKAVALAGKKTDGAMYWKAYALNRLGKRDDAIRTIEELQKRFPASRWSNDAKALLIDVRQASGQPVSPEQTADEELKLIALNGVMMRDPERALPMVEQLLNGAASPRLKARALFVLAQNSSPRAKTLLGEFAKGRGNPDLQLKALAYLGAYGGGADVPLLVEVYRSSNDIDVKKRVIRSLASGARHGKAFLDLGGLDDAAVYGESMASAREALDRAKIKFQSDMERAAADQQFAEKELSDQLQALGARAGTREERDKAREARAKEATDALWQLYQGEPSVELKREILRNMRFASQTDRLLQIAKTDADAELRRAAVQGLVLDRSATALNEALIGLYRGEKDPAVKRQVIDMLSASGAAPLVQIARQEHDPELRKRIVERLSTMKDKEAVDYMMEILKK